MGQVMWTASAAPEGARCVCGEPARLRLDGVTGPGLSFCVSCAGWIRDLTTTGVGALTIHALLGTKVDWKALNADAQAQQAANPAPADVE
jgi:hypothetical protein